MSQERNDFSEEFTLWELDSGKAVVFSAAMAALPLVNWSGEKGMVILSL